jgi:hypothetical protein
MLLTEYTKRLMNLIDHHPDLVAARCLLELVDRDVTD